MPTANQPSFQYHALNRIADVLTRSLVREDLCATHHLLCVDDALAACDLKAFRGPRVEATIRVATFKPGHGHATDNFYHFFFGLLVPFFHWMHETPPRPGDVVVLNDHLTNGVPHKFLPDLLRVAGRASCVQLGVVDAGRNGSDATSSAVTLGNQHHDWSLLDDPSRPRLVRPPEWGLDYHLYGCGFFSDDAKADLATRIRRARRALLDACRCPTVDPTAVLLVERRSQISLPTHQNRSVPNFPELVAHLRRQPYGDRLKVVDFGDLPLCDQFCATASAQVLVAQHGAGLSNAAFLQERSAVVEITPKKMWSRSIYHCLAGTRDVHYDRVPQNDMHDPVDVVAVHTAVQIALDKVRTHVPSDARYPKPGGHHLKVCDKTNPDWEAPVDCGYGR